MATVETEKGSVDFEESMEAESTEAMSCDTNDSKDEVSPEQLQATAELFKNDGNTFYKEKNYAEAVKLYTKAIDTCPNCAAYYGNRSAAYMMLNRYDKALEDARLSVSIDPNFTKGHIREGKCHLAMGEPVAAKNCFNKVIDSGNDSAAIQHDLVRANKLQQCMTSAESSYAAQDFRKVVWLMDQCVEVAPACKKFKVHKAECLARLKRYHEAQDIANDVLQFESSNIEALYVRGLCLYYQDNTDKAFQHFQHVLRCAPDHPHAKDVYKKAKQLKLKKEEGNMAFKRGRLQEAHNFYTDALAIDPNNDIVNSKLYFNRATVSSKTKKYTEAIADCTKAIQLDDSYQKAYMRRAKCYMDTEQYEEAVRDYEKVCQMDRNRENKRILQNAKLELKKSKRKDYYKILGVSKDADEDAIKKAYRKRALLHHPDRHASATEAEKKEEEKKFKEVGEAYTVLTDAKKRARYDQGHDLEDLDGGFGGADIDPNHIFQAFFGGGGAPGGFSFSSSHGGHGSQHGQFPGGFSFQFG